MSWLNGIVSHMCPVGFATYKTPQLVVTSIPSSLLPRLAAYRLVIPPSMSSAASGWDIRMDLMESSWRQAENWWFRLKKRRGLGHRSQVRCCCLVRVVVAAQLGVAEWSWRFWCQVVPGTSHYPLKSLSFAISRNGRLKETFMVYNVVFIKKHSWTCIMMNL